MNPLQECQLEILKEIDRICKKHNINYCLSSGTLIGAIRHKGFIPWDDDLDLNMDIKDFRKFAKVAKKEMSDRFFLQSSDTDLWYRAFFKVRMNNTTMIEKSYENIHFHQGVWVDIFPIIAMPDDPKKIERINKWIQISDLMVQDAFFAVSDHLSAKLKLISKIPLKLRRMICRMIRKAIFKPMEKSELCDYYWGFPFRKPRFKTEMFRENIPAEFEDGLYMIPKEYDRILTITYGDYMTPPPPENRNGGHDVALLDLENSYTKYI